MSAIRIFVQARMSSQRFPGKVLAPLAGRPLIAHVVERCGAAFGADRVIVATSTQSSDDVLARAVAGLGCAVFRGELDNVLRRFQQCLKQYPCDWFVRISADSPLIDPGLIARIAEQRAPELDLVTNVQERTFPPGQSVEVVRAERFAGIDSESLAADEREHVTLAYYRSPGQYRIRNVVSRDATLARRSMTVDTPEDLRRVETLMAGSA
jgi:spore coat polysaccharide biosynthesis protein SpsF (cytidylyltransferase family)